MSDTYLNLISQLGEPELFLRTISGLNREDRQKAIAKAAELKDVIFIEATRKALLSCDNWQNHLGKTTTVGILVDTLGWVVASGTPSQLKNAAYESAQLFEPTQWIELLWVATRNKRADQIAVLGPHLKTSGSGLNCLLFAIQDGDTSVVSALIPFCDVKTNSSWPLRASAIRQNAAMVNILIPHSDVEDALEFAVLGSNPESADFIFTHLEDQQKNNLALNNPNLLTRPVISAWKSRIELVQSTQSSHEHSQARSSLKKI